MSAPVVVAVKVVGGAAVLPQYMTAGASGMDVRAAESAVLEPGARAAVGTGLAVAVPRGWEIQIRPRSGLALRHGVTVVNAPGTIDSDYRGEIRILLVNLGRDAYAIERGDRIAQMVLCPVGRLQWAQSDTLDSTDRGGGGFGSTGVK
jgi:dUTP pyrophosphatase